MSRLRVTDESDNTRACYLSICLTELRAVSQGNPHLALLQQSFFALTATNLSDESPDELSAYSD